MEPTVDVSTAPYPEVEVDLTKPEAPKPSPKCCPALPPMPPMPCEYPPDLDMVTAIVTDNESWAHCDAPRERFSPLTTTVHVHTTHPWSVHVRD